MSRTLWRWDQGHQRLLDFQSVQSIAKVFAANDGVKVRQRGFDALREPLGATGLSFPTGQQGHDTWRQYQRAFKLGMLADLEGGELRPTDVCRVLASDPQAVADDFLLLFARRFCLPFPGFTGFQSGVRPIYPAAAVLKLMLANSASDDLFRIDAQSALDFIAGNNVDGAEPLDTYRGLARVPVVADGDEIRQVREMLSFLAQVSWLFWEQSTLKMAFQVDDVAANEYANLLTPDVSISNLSASEAFRALTSLDNAVLPVAPGATSETEGIQYFEGLRKAVTHLRIERSRKLRLAVLASFEGSAFCDACKIHPADRYPWVDSFLQVHHLLPLASTLARGNDGTRIEDVRPVCPNCHTAVHIYYANWLRLNKQDDFTSFDESLHVYEEAKRKVIA